MCRGFCARGRHSESLAVAGRRVRLTHPPARGITRAGDRDSLPPMSELSKSLPDDVEALRALVLSALAERDAALAARDRAVERNEKLLHLLQQLRRARFGRSSEKLDAEQLQLALEDIEQAVARSEAEAQEQDEKPRTERAKRRSPSRP